MEDKNELCTKLEDIQFKALRIALAKEIVMAQCEKILRENGRGYKMAGVGQKIKDDDMMSFEHIPSDGPDLQSYIRSKIGYFLSSAGVLISK